MNINELEKQCQDELLASGFEEQRIEAVHVQFGVVPQYHEVVVVCAGPIVYRGLYDSQRGLCSRLRKMEAPKTEVR